MLSSLLKICDYVILSTLLLISLRPSFYMFIYHYFLSLLSFFYYIKGKMSQRKGEKIIVEARANICVQG